MRFEVRHIHLLHDYILWPRRKKLAADLNLVFIQVHDIYFLVQEKKITSGVEAGEAETTTMGRK